MANTEAKPNGTLKPIDKTHHCFEIMENVRKMAEPMYNAIKKPNNIIEITVVLMKVKRIDILSVGGRWSGIGWLSSR